MSRIPGKMWIVLLATLVFGVLATLPLLGCSAAAPKYPNKPIDLIVPYAPGGGSDLSARLIAGYASKKLGQPVNVVNVTGASGITGTMQMLGAKPDGYTLMIDGTSNTSFLAAARTDLPFKLEDRTWLGRWVGDPMFYMFSASTPFKNLKDAMDLAKAKPGDYTWGAGAQGSQSMFHGLTLLMDAGVDPLKTKMVVFPEGMAPSVQAVLAGTVMEAGAMATDVAKLLPTGKVKVLGVGTAERAKAYPDVPTAKEQGFATSTLVSWYGLSGPKGLPSDVVDAWTKLAQDAAKDADFRAEADKQNKVLSYLGAKEHQDYVLNETKSMTTLAGKIGIRK
ncbi:MAG: Bug family tripartite tricarboxylate transporter substrate binding protein [Chloroflexota bacterium]